MHSVYIIQSINCPSQHYTGVSADLKTRLGDHNDGKSKHTSKFKPWKIICYLKFTDEKKATDFEKYLKTGSGRAFMKKHLL